MKIAPWLMSLSCCLGLCTVAAMAQDTMRFYRVVSPTQTVITALGTDGVMTWSNKITGLDCLIQSARDLMDPAAWADYAHVPATSVTMSLRVSHPNPPPGMTLIPGDYFVMGATTNVGQESYTGETPQHPVYVSVFYMDKCEVTKALWDEVYTWALSHGYDFDHPGDGKSTNHPVQTVNWYDCVKWCNARSEKEGLTPAYYTSASRSPVTAYRAGQVNVQTNWVLWNKGYRLPTEAEWEKAARGGMRNRRFAWIDADTIQHARANYYSTISQPYDTSPTRGFHPTYAVGGYPYTSPVGVFPHNGHGLYDMTGNVWEWCWDWHSPSYYESSQASDPPGPETGLFRVLRGGSWATSAVDGRVATRWYYLPDYAFYSVGFRTLLPLAQ